MTASLALGLLVQPVIAAIGEVDEVVSGRHVEAATPPAARPLPGVAAAADEPDALQLVHHIAQCCGYIAAMPADAIAVPDLVASRSVLRLVVVHAASAGRSQAPFRPPIAG